VRVLVGSALAAIRSMKPKEIPANLDQRGTEEPGDLRLAGGNYSTILFPLAQLAAV
jgi:hypothetical protein